MLHGVSTTSSADIFCLILRCTDNGFTGNICLALATPHPPNYCRTEQEWAEGKRTHAVNCGEMAWKYHSQVPILGEIDRVISEGEASSAANGETFFFSRNKLTAVAVPGVFGGHPMNCQVVHRNMGSAGKFSIFWAHGRHFSGPPLSLSSVGEWSFEHQSLQGLRYLVSCRLRCLGYTLPSVRACALRQANRVTFFVLATQETWHPGYEAWPPRSRRALIDRLAPGK